MDQYLTVIVDRPTGLFQGALFGNVPTPSGATRYRCLEHCTETHAKAAAALEEIASIHPTLPKAPVEGLDVPEHLMPAMGDEVCVVRPKEPKEASFVEIRQSTGSEWRSSDLSMDQVRTMIMRGVLEMDSSSGNDPELSATYDTYVVVKDLAEMARPGQ